MYKNKKRITNEKLSKKFENNFDLVNYAISLAENMIHSGRDSRVESDLQNRAMLILEEIDQGKDRFDDVMVGRDQGDGFVDKLQGMKEETQEKIVFEQEVVVPFSVDEEE